MSSNATLHVLILGGYGTFGGRLAQLLAGDARLSLWIAGRSVARAKSFCERLAPGASREAVGFDRDGDVLMQIARVDPDIVVDATGPFQCYGADPYRIVRACLFHRIDYLDLADSADFVRGIVQFDLEATEREVVVLSGVSSFPVLSAAVVRRLARGLAKLDTVTGGIAPSPYAGVGANVIRAIASYAGRRLALIRDGRPAFGVAMVESLRYTISPPGYLPLRPTRFSLVDVPDLQLLPELWPDLQAVWMGAGPVPEVLHRLLNALAWLVRIGVLRSLLPFAWLMHRVSNRVRWGEHRGGMFVVVTGTNEQGARLERSWHLVAEGEAGPLIPSMACQAIIERCVDGQRPAPGARAASSDLELEDYDALFARRAIHTGMRRSDSSTAGRPLYHRILDDAWQLLPKTLRAIHAGTGPRIAAGRADVERGVHPLARLIAHTMGFPAAGKQVAVRVEFSPEGYGERWTRTFAGQSFTSMQSAGRRSSAHLLRERFGLLTFGLALVIDGSKLRFVVQRWSIWGIALPTFPGAGRRLL